MHMMSSIQDAPGRSFPLWGSRALQMTKVDPMVPEKDAVVNLIPEISINLQKFGKKLEKMTASEQTHALDNMQRKHGEALPRVQDVLGLCECPHVMTLQDFFNLYYTPTMCLGGPLDSEICWPLPATLNY